MEPPREFRPQGLFVLNHADWQQLHRAHGSRSELAVAIQASPLKDLVRVDTMLQSHPCHRSTRLQRLLHNPATLHRAPPTTRFRQHSTAHSNVCHPHIIIAQSKRVHPANTGRLPENASTANIATANTATENLVIPAQPESLYLFLGGARRTTACDTDHTQTY